MISSQSTISSDDSLQHFRCVDCQGELTHADEHLACSNCGSTFAIDEGLLITAKEFEGNNQVAAEFYNSPKWHRYRFWKRFTPFNETAVSKWRAEVFADLPELENTRLLDVAIGAGLTMPLVPESCDVFGVDISMQQLRDCQRNNAGRSLRLVLGEAEALPFADNTFDNGLSFGAINYFNDPLKSLQEMARVVKPGGHLVVTDEHADLPKRMIGHRIGWPQLDHWILSKFLHLGNDFAEVIETHTEFAIEPIVEQVFDEWNIHPCCNEVAYCIVATVR